MLFSMMVMFIQSTFTLAYIRFRWYCCCSRLTAIHRTAIHRHRNYSTAIARSAIVISVTIVLFFIMLFLLGWLFIANYRNSNGWNYWFAVEWTCCICWIGYMICINVGVCYFVGSCSCDAWIFTKGIYCLV